MNAKQVWFVTGASKGLGLALVEELLRQGHRVAATSRTADKFSPDLRANPDFLPLSMNFTDAEVQQAVSQAAQYFGRLDVVVNNAGYALLGTLEEFSMQDIEQSFEVNVFGTMRVCRAALPIMRQQRHGHLLNIASVSGSVTGVASGLYSATKAAVLQLSEALAQEVAEFGITVTAICPGGMRTDFLDRSSMRTATHPMPEYQTVRNVMERYGELNKHQGGNPAKAARAFIELAALPQPPARMYFGSDALQMMDRKIRSVVQDLQHYQDFSRQTDG